MRITIEADPGYAGRTMAQHAAEKIRRAMPGAEVVIVGPGLPRLPRAYSAMAHGDYGVRQMMWSLPLTS